jgi:hypothetical protein
MVHKSRLAIVRSPACIPRHYLGRSKGVGNREAGIAGMHILAEI